MNTTVQPIRDKELLKEIKAYLKETNERNYIMFLLGIHTGLRISDILQLKVRDVEGWFIYIHEQKTKKSRRPREIRMPNELKRALRSYIEGKPRNEYLIKSRNGENKPITRQMAYVILQQVADEFDLERIGTHSLRKTYGYQHYQKFNDVVGLMEVFNHHDQADTLRYIGFRQQEINERQRKVDW